MSDSKINGKEFSIKCTVGSLGRSELARKEGDRVPSTFNVLLKNGVNCCFRCVCHQAGWGIG